MLDASVVVGRCMGGISIELRRYLPGMDSYLVPTYLDLRSGLYLRCVVRITVYPVTFLTHRFRAARMSLIFSIIRTANSSGDKIHKRITYLIAASFMVMWAALVVYKISVCIYYSCRMTKAVALSQLVTDVAADASLIVAPIQFWKDVGLTRNSKILILSTFGSSVLITVITIPHSIMLFHSITETVIIVAHVKAALSLVICNLLVIVTLVYRVCWKEMLDLDQSFTSPGIFSSVIVTQFPFNTNSRMSPSIQEEHTRDK